MGAEEDGVVFFALLCDGEYFFFRPRERTKSIDFGTSPICEKSPVRPITHPARINRIEYPILLSTWLLRRPFDCHFILVLFFYFFTFYNFHAE